MKKSTIGAILIVVLSLVAVAAIYLFYNWRLRGTSDSQASASVRIAGDNYLGYWFITSPDMRRQSLQQGLRIEFTDDGGNYADRLERFANREYDMIVLPANSYVEHGAAYGYPGVIPAAISESNGADGIVGFSDRVGGGDVSNLNDASLEIVYTGQSPSSFLLDLTIADFDMFNLASDNRWRREVGSSSEALEHANSRNGDVFVLWEPDLSRALEIEGIEYIWGSDKFSGYIVDVFVVHRDFLVDQPETVQAFLRTYFRVLSSYSLDRDRMIEEMGRSTNLDPDIVEAMLGKVEWFDLSENATVQFGPTSKLIDTIFAATDVLVLSGTLPGDPLGGDPYAITNSSIVEEIRRSTPADLAASGPGPADFESIDEDTWQRLGEIGSLRAEPPTFQFGDEALDEAGKEVVDAAADLLVNHYPAYRVSIRGHTGPGENESENVRLSLERARIVEQYLVATHGVDPDRVRSEGLGSGQPPQQRPNESARAYRYRLARVEFVLLEPNPL